jgi:NOL1/NOP2/fmu family ribosome biogenesis protein
MKGKVFLPDIDIAWSVFSSNLIPDIQVDEAQAIRFLQGESINHGPDSNHDFALIRYQDANLGWVKRSGKHWSNHYPKDYRIRSRYIPKSN